LSFDVSADDEDELGDDMLLPDVLLVLSVAPGVPEVAPVPDVPAVPDDDDDELSVDGVVDDDDEDDGDDGLMVPVVDELELDAGGVVVLGVVVDELELEAGGVVGVVVDVLDSRLQPARPIAAAMARTASGFAFMRVILRSEVRDGSCDPSFSRIGAIRPGRGTAATSAAEPVPREGISRGVGPGRRSPRGMKASAGGRRRSRSFKHRL
jgi:hypothetical protein